MKPRYPIYVISKGRWESRLTVKALERMGAPYWVVVEPQEFGHYASVIDSGKILILPFGDLGQGSIPARNWVWDHSASEGHARHWILDDNISRFCRFNRGRRTRTDDPSIFAWAESFIDRYVNVPMAGFQYEMFGVTSVTRCIRKPFLLNTRIYSCILLSNEVSHRWRGRYNEDTDLSLRFLKDGYCTVLFYAFLAKKIATMRMEGGNTEELYCGDGRLEMAKSLRRQHPDVVTITRKWGRWQHLVDYRPFKGNRLRRKPGRLNVLEQVTH